MTSHPPQARPVERLEVPFVDLSPANARVKERVLARIAETIDRGDFVNGGFVELFERAFAAHTKRLHCVGLASGLDALRLALLAAQLEPGAGVIVPAATFAASLEAVLQAGGSPVLVDVCADDYTLDVGETEKAAGRASHVMPVHLYGQMADMRGLSRIAKIHNLRIVEDACQAHGSRRDGLVPGDATDAAAFSFYPSKNLGAMGDAGALVTDDEELALRVRALRVHGETRKYHHDFVGYTARLDTVQAAVLLEKLPLLAEWNEQRREAAAFYSTALPNLSELRSPPQPATSEPVWHLYVVRTPEPEDLAAFLADRGVQTGRHYPQPLHLSPAYRELGYAAGDFPIAESLAREGLSLPLYPGISERQLEHVCDAIRAYFGGG
jgi:dTDP-4-amino-4,6-dideoxygalactose transaminase